MEPPPQPPLPAPAPVADLGAALRTACSKGDLAEVQRLVAAGAPLESRDNLWHTPLFLAAHGNPEVVKFLLSRGARVDAIAKNGDTVIGEACDMGNVENAKVLLAAGADVNRQNKWGRSPLVLAARDGRDDVVAWLIAQHIDVNHEGNGGSALVYAVWKDHFVIAKMLLDAGADEKKAAASALRISRSDTLLSAAAFANDIPLVDLLMDHGALLSDSDKLGRTVLMTALQQQDHPATIDHLLEKGADVNAQNSKGQTPLMLAINYQPVSGLGDLITHGARLETKDNRGRTALMWATHFVLEDQIRFLVAQDADINATDNAGETALTIAGDCGASALVDYFKEMGAKRTDLHILQRPSSNPPLPPAQSWALAVGAIYTQRNGTNPHLLGYDANALEPDEAENELKNDWDIANKNQLLRELGILRDLGDRADLQKLGARLTALTDATFDGVLRGPSMDAHRKTSLTAVRANYLLWKDKSGLAFDLCRRAHMICMGYAAGYVTETEAWPLLLDNARMTQAAFHSWHEMGDNFLDGREAGTGERDPRLGACARLLQNPNDPNSPWNQLPWNTDLSDTQSLSSTPALSPH